MAHVLAKDLRESLLKYALSGNLTKQDDYDTEIEDYIKIIKKEEKKTSKKDITTPLIDISELPDIPNNWRYIRLNDLVSKEIKRGKSPKYDEKGKALAFAQKCNSKHTGIRIDLALHLSDFSLDRYSEEDNLKDLDIVINSTGGGTLGRVGLYKEKYNKDNLSIYPDSHVTVIRAKKCVNPLYLYIFLKQQSPYLETLGTGSTNQTELKPQVIKDLVVPLPPIEEQARIVAKVDELMAKLDEYEKKEKELVELKVDFPKEMRDAILQAAISGKMNLQDINDSNAFELAKEISTKDKKWKPINEDDLPFSIPEHWTWMRLREFAKISAGGTPNRSEPKYWNGNIPWIKIGNMTSKYVADVDEYITEEGLNNSSAKWVKKGTILYSIFASIGTVGILDIDATTNQAIAAVEVDQSMNKDYMYYVLVALKNVLLRQGHGMAQMNINQEILKDTPIPIPPIEEQQRIAEKLNQLLPMCDELVNLC